MAAALLLAQTVVGVVVVQAQSVRMAQPTKEAMVATEQPHPFLAAALLMLAVAAVLQVLLEQAEPVVVAPVGQVRLWLAHLVLPTRAVAVAVRFLRAVRLAAQAALAS